MCTESLAVTTKCLHARIIGRRLTTHIARHCINSAFFFSYFNYQMPLYSKIHYGNREEWCDSFSWNATADQNPLNRYQCLHKTYGHESFTSLSYVNMRFKRGLRTACCRSPYFCRRWFFFFSIVYSLKKVVHLFSQLKCF